MASSAAVPQIRTVYQGSIKKPETKRTVSANANGTLINVMIISPRPVLSPPWTVLGIGTVKPPSAHASDVYDKATKSKTKNAQSNNLRAIIVRSFVGLAYRLL
jgi:hypothetical protein